MTSVNRRTLLQAGLAGGVVSALGGAPAFAYRPGGRPALTHGVQSGDATASSATVWARADRPGRLWVEASRRPDFRGSRLVRGPVLTPDSDLTGKVRLRDLPSGTDVHYRVRVESLDRPGLFSFPEPGRLSTAPRRRQDLRFVWTGDVVGQGWGIDPAFGGLKIFESMRRRRPDFLLHSGDTVYADGPLTDSVTLPDGRTYRNLVTEAKSKVAETLAEYRGQYAYNLLDEHYKAFTAEVAQVNQWDDHEVLNNWYPGEILDDPRYREKRVDVLAARAHRAYREWTPIPSASGPVYRKLSYGPLLDVFVLDMRSSKDPNDANTSTDPTRGTLGHTQRRWLQRELRQSRATWKIIANDLPLGVVVPDGPTAQEGVAQGDGGHAARPRARVRGGPAPRPPARRHRDRLPHRRRALHRSPPLRPRPRRRAGLHPVLGVRLRPGARRRLRPQHPRRDLRSRSGLRARPAGGQHVTGRGLPALRRGQHRQPDGRAPRRPPRP